VPEHLGPVVGSAPGWPLVLYFHHVDAGIDHYTALPPDDFRRGLELVLERYGPPLDPAAIGPGFRPPDHPTVLVTFDDGYRNNLTRAAPVLAELGVPMLLFAITGRIGRPAAAGRGSFEARDDFLTWAEVAELRRRGHAVGAHSRTHRPLTDVPPAEARREVDESLAEVARHTGAPVTTFAYPYGAVPAADPVPPEVFAFGTVKAPARPWTAAPHGIRRTYLPAGDVAAWPALVTGWRRQWFASR
jgi:peptidoglycan/xylan/chitin deacetylase (PgdA/CDA1 family)